MDERKATIASNLIKLRLAAGMTQAELGEKLNYSDKSISKWERGDVTTDVFVLMQIAEIFGVDVDYLLKPFHDGDLEHAITQLQTRIAPKAAEHDAGISVRKGDKSRYVLEAMDYISKHYNEPDISVGTVAESLNISEGYLSHTFKKETDYTLLNYLTRYRIHKAMELLKDCRVKVYEVAEQVGYRDIAYFSATFKKYAGISPSEYQLSRR